MKDPKFKPSKLGKKLLDAMDAMAASAREHGVDLTDKEIDAVIRKARRERRARLVKKNAPKSAPRR